MTQIPPPSSSDVKDADAFPTVGSWSLCSSDTSDNVICLHIIHDVLICCKKCIFWLCILLFSLISLMMLCPWKNYLFMLCCCLLFTQLCVNSIECCVRKSQINSPSGTNNHALFSILMLNGTITEALDLCPHDFMPCCHMIGWFGIYYEYFANWPKPTKKIHWLRNSKSVKG